LIERICITCESTTTYIVPKTGKIKWYRKGLEYICHKCYRKDFYKRSDIIKNSVYNWRKNNPEKEREIKRKYARNNPQIFIKASIKYQNNNFDKVKQKVVDLMERLGESFNMSCPEYQSALIIWSRIVKKRDNHVCIEYGSNDRVQAHHVLEKKDYPEFSLLPMNGLTLCHECHWNKHREVQYHQH